MYHSAVISCR